MKTLKLIFILIALSPYALYADDSAPAAEEIIEQVNDMPETNAGAKDDCE